MTSEVQSGSASRAKSRLSSLRSLPAAVVASLILGLAIGTVMRAMTASGWVGPVVGVFDVIGTMWVNAIRMTVIPLIVPLLIGSIAGAGSGRVAGRLGMTTIAAIQRPTK